MEEKPILYLYEEINYALGQPIFVESRNENDYSVVFEDDGKTGYFYAIDQEGDSKIEDALHIYDVGDIMDKNRPSTLKILWSEDQTKAFLSINGYYHAVFDFGNNFGYCRNGYPENKAKNQEKLLTDQLIDEISKLHIKHP